MVTESWLVLRRISENAIHTLMQVPRIKWYFFLDREMEILKTIEKRTWLEYEFCQLCLFWTHLISGLSGEEHEVGHGAHEDEHAVEGERDEEEIEISIVPLSDTVTHPRAVVVKSLNTVVTNWAVGGSGRPEYLASETKLQLDRLSLDLKQRNYI